MNHRLRFVILLAAACLVFPQRSPAPVIFQSGKGVKYQAPGEEEVNATARELFERGQAAEKEGDYKRAIKSYQRIVRKYPKDTLAPGAAFRTGQLQEQRGTYFRSAEAYRWVVEKYPQSPHFEEAIEGQFRIGEIFLGGKKRRILGVPIKNTLPQAVEVFAAIVRTAPYGKYTARAQFNIGLAREKQGLNDAALAAYQAVIDKFPDDPVAVDAQYQIGYMWYDATMAGTQDPNAISKAKTGFEDFLFRYPHSEKAGQARENLGRLQHEATSDSFGIAKFYDKRKNYRAAVIYYNDVIRQQPGSPEGDQAKKRVDELRAKVGDAALQPALSVAAAAKKKSSIANTGESGRSAPAMHGSPADIPPLPPPESDLSLPPPASLAPENTTAPASAPFPDLSSTPEPSPVPQESAAPESTPSPAP